MVILVYYIKCPREWFVVVVVAIPICLDDVDPSMDDRPWTTLSLDRPQNPEKNLILQKIGLVDFFKTLI